MSQNLILDKIKCVSILLAEARSQITSIVFRCQYPVRVFRSETLTKPFAQSRSIPSIWYWIFISFFCQPHKYNNRRATVVTRLSDIRMEQRSEKIWRHFWKKISNQNRVEREKLETKMPKTPHRWYQCSYDLIEIYTGKRRNKSLCVWKKN